MTPAERMTAEKRSAKLRPSPRPKRKVVWRCRLRVKREILGLSQRDVAKGAGVGFTIVHTAECGHDVVLTNAVLIAAFFGCTVHELWPERA